MSACTSMVSGVAKAESGEVPAGGGGGFLQSVVNPRTMKMGYHYLVTYGLKVMVLVFVSWAALAVAGRMQDPEQMGSYWQLWARRPEFDSAVVRVMVACTTIVVVALALHAVLTGGPTYLVDHACYLPPKHLEVPREKFLERSRASGYFDETSMEFQEKILDRSGLSERTCLPAGLHAHPQELDMQAARKEAEDVMFACLDELFEKTRVKPRDVGILVANCGMFSPTPSVSAMIVNKYKMRSDTRTFNLGGMGCSASIIAVDLVRDILRLHPNSYAVLYSSENITQNWYLGNRRSMLIPNCLFRVGGAAVLLSNKWSERLRSKYKLSTIVRTHKGANDKSHLCVIQREDEQGKKGVVLSKDIMGIAGEALTTNMTTLGPRVLPASELLLYFGNLVGRKVLHMKTLKPYIPDFKLAFEHFCIHSGGRAVVDAIQTNLQLSDQDCEASRMTLYRFGNVSSASIWYELAYIEAKGRVRRGDRVWQIAFGSGFKCNSAVWHSLRTIKPPPAKYSPWIDCLDELEGIPEMKKML